MSLLSLFGLAPPAVPLALGAPAPEVCAPDENGETVDVGKAVRHGLALVYFYPKASTPGCTMQACSLRDSIADLASLGVTVIGVSRDTPAAQRRFKESHRLPFTLLADREGRVIEAFGVATIVFGISQRQSFLFRDGQLVWRSLSAETRNHAAEVKQAIAALPPA